MWQKQQGVSERHERKRRVFANDVVIVFELIVTREGACFLFCNT